jgi:hypothetical protein
MSFAAYIRDAQGVIQIFQNMNLQGSGASQTTSVPWPEYDVVLSILGVTGSPSPGYLFLAPHDYGQPALTGELVVLPFGPNNSIWGYRYRVTWPWITIALICNSCSSSNYYTIDLYLSNGI